MDRVARLAWAIAGYAAFGLLALALARALGGFGAAHALPTAALIVLALGGPAIGGVIRRRARDRQRRRGADHEGALAELALAFGERVVGAASLAEIQRLLAHAIRDGTRAVNVTLIGRSDDGPAFRSEPALDASLSKSLEPAVRAAAAPTRPDPADQAALASLMAQTWSELVIPLPSRGEVVGLVAVGSPPGRRLHDPERAFVRALADRASSAVVAARMLERVERRAHGLEDEVRARTRELASALEALQQAQARLVHSEQMAALGLLVAGISHEINNALNLIYGNLPTLERYVATLSELASAYAALTPDGGAGALGDAAAALPLAQAGAVEVCGEIAAGARRAREIVEGLRRFGRGGEAKPGEVRVAEGLSSALALLRRRLPRELELIERLDPSAPPVRGRAAELNQVWLALLLGALEPARTRAAPRLEAYTGLGVNGQVVVQVSEGQTEGDFDPLAVPDGSATLALAVAREIVERHGGRLQQARGPAGTRFRVELPPIALAEASS
jgi:signal transduction histidine kinase